MKFISKIMSFLLAFSTLLLTLALVGCDSNGTAGGTTAAPSPVSTAVPDATTAQPGTTTAVNETTAVEETTGESGSFAKVPETLKILAVGNSFSTDAMQFLWQIATSMGVKNVILGNLYIGGCSIDTHWTNAKTNAAAYIYYKNTTGTFAGYDNKTMLNGITDEEWDVITVQQTSKTCGLGTSYGYLDDLVGYIRANMKNPACRVLFHQTWAYAQNSTHASFPNYDSSQTKMYSMICDVIENVVKKTEGIDGIIPGGTAVQNGRSGFVGDNFCRDGYHMHMILGRYLLGLTWFASITGASVADCDYNPNAKVITDEVMALCKEAAANAVLTPGSVTQSKYTQTPATKYDLTITTVDASPDTTVYTMEEFYELDSATLKAALGLDLSNYTVFEWNYTENAYYYCTKGMDITKPSAGSSTYHQNICSDIYKKEQLPEGTLIICDPGYQYRPEKWVTENVAASSRPGIVSGNVIVMDKTWWGDNQFCAINLSSNPKSDISTYYLAASKHIRFYVPKA